MKLEAQTLAKIKTRINEKVMGCCGTWIDWQYLLDAAALLAKCRYTLQYTYPYAYYMEPSPRKELVSDKTYEVSWYDIDLTKNTMNEMSSSTQILLRLQPLWNLFTKICGFACKLILMTSSKIPNIIRVYLPHFLKIFGPQIGFCNLQSKIQVWCYSNFFY